MLDTSNPIDLFEEIASAHEWSYDRSNAHEVAVEISGSWCDYRIIASWRDEMCALHFACAFDMRIPDRRRSEVNQLLAGINERLAVGHFDVWSDDGFPVFRHAVLMRGMPGASVEQLEDLLEIALTECERFYPAFQYVVWGGKTPTEAMDAALLTTVGEA
jgi:hypothetical protein